MLVLEKMGSNKQKGKISVSHGKEILKEKRRKIQMSRRQDCGSKWSEKLGKENLQKGRKIKYM